MAKYQSSSYRKGTIIPAGMFVNRVADLDTDTRMDPLLIRSLQKPNMEVRLFEGQRILSPHSSPLVLSKASSQVCVSEIEFTEILGK